MAGNYRYRRVMHGRQLKNVIVRTGKPRTADNMSRNQDRKEAENGF